ncbi:AraC family transcriptional regulator [Emticicia sp. BO119]|uniref:helix-turn-helix domain-containing protein n=1 Tax=Emticicia sp. BO119 TaxID=2757768 RepID=UPI0015EFFB20|nr:AraC family transcriptional regulator [Emticicia sp. BO119]MBA4851273.1 helix-turn-helix transcriptional regulator [Emticicia sp. BO119]
MQATKISSCYLGPQISPEEFVTEHFFLYLVKGRMNGYDGNKYATLEAGECCLVRKNHLARYNKQKQDNAFEKVVVIFDEDFLKRCQEKYQFAIIKSDKGDAFLRLKDDALIPNFLQSLAPYYNGNGQIDPLFADIKREELLLILLKTNPELYTILFDFTEPSKINLEEFMNRNFRFNVSLERFAYMTGRSLSTFKRDFEKIFSDTPSHWLMQKRLHEAYFLLEKTGKKVSDTYLEVGFEDLSHFSFVFKKQFGVAPSEVLGKV